jgi:predicted alpha/beta-hydrolase family hydrolase
MVAFASGIAARGIDVITFDFPYAAAGRKLPDRGPKLDACWQAVWKLARTEWPTRKPAQTLFVGGKSMGGRIASQLVASGQLAAAGLVLLGYPLRPPTTRTGKPARLRADHLPDLAAVPTLVIQGERDEFGGPDELRKHFPATTRIVGVRGPHSFAESAWPEAIALVADFVSADVPRHR